MWLSSVLEFIQIFTQCDAIRWEQFWRDVVLKSMNMASSYGDSILDQIYEKQIFSILQYEDFDFV